LKVLDGLKERFRKLIEREGLMAEAITIKAFPLTPEEAIGNPEERDYPLVRGRERLMEATFKGAKGQAYTDIDHKCGPQASRRDRWYSPL